MVSRSNLLIVMCTLIVFASAAYILIPNQEKINVETNGFKTGACVYYGIESLENAYFLANNYDLLVLNLEDLNYARIIKEQNPHIILLMYKHIGCNKDDKLHSACNDYQNIQNNHPSWFLERDGKYIRDTYFEQGDWEVNYLDISNPKTREWMIDRYIEDLDSAEVFDGLLVDIAPSSLYYYGGPTNKIKTDLAAYNSYKNFLIQTKASLNNKGYIFIPEWSRMSEEGYWSELIEFSNGAFEEAYYYDWDGNPRESKALQVQKNDILSTVSIERLYLAGIWLDKLGFPNDYEEKSIAAIKSLREIGSDHIIVMAPHGKYNFEAAKKGAELFSKIQS